MKRLYVAGPMSGLPERNFPAFHAAAARLRAAGFEVENPAEINAEQRGGWEACLRADIARLMTCDGIALLPGWEESRGANLECDIAHRLGMPAAPLESWLLSEAKQGHIYQHGENRVMAMESGRDVVTVRQLDPHSEWLGPSFRVHREFLCPMPMRYFGGKVPA